MMNEIRNNKNEARRKGEKSQTFHKTTPPTSSPLTRPPSVIVYNED